MARTYLFFRPTRLPLKTEDLSEATVSMLQDGPEVRAALEQAFPGLAWQPDHVGQATVEGNWYELRLPASPAETLSLRCSLRVDHSGFVQALCDRLGWLAFDERPMCFQPHQDPMPA